MNVEMAEDGSEVTLWCAVFREASVLPVTISRGATVYALQKLLADILSTAQVAVPPRLVTLRIAQKNGMWLRVDEHLDGFLRGGVDTTYKKMLAPWDLAEPDYFGPEFKLREKVVHVLVEIPPHLLAATSGEAQESGEDVIRCGSEGSHRVGEEGVNLDDERTLPRSDLTNDIITRLDQDHVLLIKSPPMTGKTSLAALVSRELVSKSLDYNRTQTSDAQQKRKTLVASFSFLGVAADETFENAFKQKCGIEWSEVGSRASKGYVVYIVVDETQMLYNKVGCGSPRRKSDTFWGLVKDALGNKKLNFRVLMFAAYGSHPQYSQLSTPVKIPQELVLGIEHLNFRRDEAQEYVKRWFKGFQCLQNSTRLFYSHFAVLTGGHVGLCVAAIDMLNKLYESRQRRVEAHRKAEEWIRLVEQGSLLQDNDGALFDALNNTRAVQVVGRLEKAEFEVLKRFVYGERLDLGADIVKKCIQVGILAQTRDDKVVFSSTAMWRYLVKLCVGNIQRAIDRPKTLQEMIFRVTKAINYECVRGTLGKTKSTNIPLERAWQMEFYQASHRCTPHSTFVTSADVGAIFGSPGYIDFTIHCGDDFWGIELLREANKLDGHISRFGPGGNYSLLSLTDFCLLDFRRVLSMDNAATRESIAQDLRYCDKLFVLCYDEELTHAWLLNGESVWSVL